MRRIPILLAIAFATACSTVPAPAPSSAPATPDTVRANQAVVQQRVDYWVDRFSRGDRRAEIERAFARLPQQGPMITRKLQERGMPEELLYLAMAESGLNPQARSAQGAAGIWQLVPDTAKRYGLAVDAGNDERLDPEKSTDAALAHLDRLHRYFGSWYLAAAAYNAGEGRVRQIMTDVTGGSAGTDTDYYRIWDRLPAETRDYIPGMLALQRIAADPARYGFDVR